MLHCRRTIVWAVWLVVLIGMTSLPRRQPYGQVPMQILDAQHMLATRLEKRLPELISDAFLHQAVQRALQAEGKLLTSSYDNGSSRRVSGSWALLTYLGAQMLNAEVHSALTADVALGIECIVCALDLNDDLLDADVALVDVPRLALVSSVLQQLAFICVEQVPFPALRATLIETLNTGFLEVQAGQYLDLRSEQHAASTELDQGVKECIALASAKGGRLMQLACQMASMCATERGNQSEQGRLFEQFGLMLGTAHQLDNDARDFERVISPLLIATSSSSAGRVKSDVERGKKTLPIFLALYSQALPGENVWPSPLPQEQADQLRGVVAAALAVANEYLQHAHRLLLSLLSDEAQGLGLRFLAGL